MYMCRVVEALFQTLLGGLLALGGVVIGPFLQRKHEKWLLARQDEQLLREKAQELFDAIDTLVSKSQASTLSALALLKDESSAEAIPVPDLGNIRGLSTIYFPSLLDRIAKFEEDYGVVIKKVVDVAEDVMKGTSDASSLKAMPFLMTGQYQSLITDLARDLRSQLRVAVPKLSGGPPS